MPLAIDSYERLGALADEPGLLNLAWTLDERDCLAVDLAAVIERELEAEARGGLPYVNRYLVDDPYGELALGPSVAAFFSTPEWPPSITCGAGVVSLLHALAQLARGGSAHVIGSVYPDFPHWVEHCGGRCTPDLRDGGVVFVERPSLLGDELSSLSEVGELCERAAAQGATVIVDESNANYYPPRFSAVALVSELDNLVVLRGLSKGYGLGGLRLAFCIASSALRERVRSVVPPLLASSLSLRIGATVLELGDVAAPLRERIRASKQELSDLLSAVGLAPALASSEHLPYVLFDERARDASAQLASRGILGKAHAVWARPGADVRHLYRISAPLSAKRVKLLRHRLRCR